MEDKRNLNSVITAVVLFICIMYLFPQMNFSSDTKTSMSENTDVYLEAFSIANQFVKRKLKIPASAEFPFKHETGVFVFKKENSFGVNSFVDSQNSFGVMIRTYFYAEVSQTGNKQWKLNSLKFD